MIHNCWLKQRAEISSYSSKEINGITSCIRNNYGNENAMGYNANIRRKSGKQQ